MKTVTKFAYRLITVLLLSFSKEKYIHFSINMSLINASLLFLRDHKRKRECDGSLCLRHVLQKAY